MAAQFFVMSEVASNLFHENPTVFGKVRLAHFSFFLALGITATRAAGHPPTQPKGRGI
jgi:hypothetical protein